MPLTGFTILAVDDYEPHNYAISRMLQKAGGNVLRARSGKEALTMAAEHPDAILLDVNLPDISGFEVCRRLHNDPNTAKIPVVFLTATYKNPGAKAMAESVGGNTVLFYPVEQDQLFAVIRGAIAQATGA